MTRLIPVLIVAAILALAATASADPPGRPIPRSATSETTPVDYHDGPPISPGQVEAAYQQTRRCRAILGAPAYATRHHWRTTPSQAYRAWMHHGDGPEWEPCFAHEPLPDHVRKETPR